jgi:hypothetical protein
MIGSSSTAAPPNVRFSPPTSQKTTTSGDNVPKQGKVFGGRQSLQPPAAGAPLGVIVTPKGPVPTATVAMTMLVAVSITDTLGQGTTAIPCARRGGVIVVVVADRPPVPNKEARGAVTQSFVHAGQGKSNPSDPIESTPSHARPSSVPGPHPSVGAIPVGHHEVGSPSWTPVPPMPQ